MAIITLSPAGTKLGKKNLDSRHWNTKTQGTQGSAAVPKCHLPDKGKPEKKRDEPL